MTVLILGSEGFIGSSLKEKLLEKQNVEIIGLQRRPAVQTNKVRYIIASLSDFKDHLELINEADVIVHCISSLLPVNESFKKELNEVFLLTAEFLHHFRESKKHFIFISSGGAVYEPRTGLGITEDMPLKPSNIYGLSKLQLESLFLFYRDNYSLDVTILRPSNVFGYRKNNIGVNGIISTLICNSITGETTTIWGNGNAVRDYIHINDFIAALSGVIDKRLTGIYNVSSGNAKSVNDIINTVRRFSPGECRVVYRDNLYHLPEYIVLSNAKLAKILPYEKQFDFDEEIRQLADKYNSPKKN